MYIAIDREKMLLTHKHASIFTVCDLAAIEQPDAPYTIFPLYDASGFRDFTDMMLKQLYRNITGQDYPDTTKSRLSLLQVIYDVCCEVLASDASPVEADAQAKYVEAQRSLGVNKVKPYKYVKGAMLPTVPGNLFDQESMRCEVPEEKLKSAFAGNVPATYEAKPKSAAATVEERIYSIADKLWSEKGKPTEKGKVFAVRFDAAELCERAGIKRQTALSVLNKWHNERAPY